MRKTDAHILIVDDDEDVQFAARVFLQRYFTKVTTISEPKQLFNVLAKQVIDVVLLDMNYRRGIQDGREGMYWLKEIQEHTPDTVIVLMTAYSDVHIAVEAIKKGAFDFLLKPWTNDKLLATMSAALKQSRAMSKSNKLDHIQQESKGADEMIVRGKSPAYQRLRKLVEKLAPTDANILLQGENGTGKFVVAKSIHNQSDRDKEVFIHVDLGSLTENLFESELFGYAKGAFTDAKESRMGRFELADKGTIFLDEIGNLPLILQTKLLSVIQNKRIVRLGDSKEREVDVRIICATNSNLKEEVEAGSFRQDLYYRINTVEVELPALRDRREDIPEFVEFFMNKYKRKYKKEMLEIDLKAIKKLQEYNWPGNIRELEHYVERLIILADGNTISSDDVNVDNNRVSGNPSLEKQENLNLENMEKTLVSEALRKNQGNISKASKELGITRASLYRRMEKHNL